MCICYRRVQGMNLDCGLLYFFAYACIPVRIYVVKYVQSPYTYIRIYMYVQSIDAPEGSHEEN